MTLKIFADLSLPADALGTLEEGTAGHTLLFPRIPTESVLAEAQEDPGFALADVAFGQPSPAMIAAAPRLRWVQVSSSGITRYDTASFRALAAEREIVVSNSAHVYAQPCAEQALSFLLARARCLPQALATRTAGGSDAWHALRESAVPLGEQRLVIVGFGAIGERLVELLRPFAMQLVAYRRRPRGSEPLRVVSSECELGAALAVADHVVNILPASPETNAFFDARRFAQIKHGASFYNIGRGTTVDQGALLAALHSDRIATAWLDVTEPEPLPVEHPLLSEPRCYVTPHIAGGHRAEAKSLVRHFLRNLKRFEAGEALVDRVI